MQKPRDQLTLKFQDRQPLQTSVLVVDEDDGARAAMSSALGAAGFEVSMSASVAEMQIAVARSAFSIIIMEIKFSGDDGLSACRKMCERGSPPIIVASSETDVIYKILSLEFGAADYLVKPVHLRELIARIHLALNRRDFVRNPMSMHEPRSPVFAFCGYRYVPKRQQVYHPGGSGCDLTVGENKMLLHLVEHAGRTCSRSELMELGLGDAASRASRAIDARIKRVRKKLQTDNYGSLIKTVMGEGYVFTETVTTFYE